MNGNGHLNLLKNAAEEALKKQGTRVFKKSSPNGKVTAYLGKRDFIDHLTHVDPVDGVVLIETEYLRDRKVFVQVLAAFRYGREDLDVLGLDFRKDLFVSTMQVYPPLPKNERPLTWLQERLIKKLGHNAYPFFFELSHSTPASVTLQPGPGDGGKPCGVDYELRTYVGEDADDKPHKRNSVRLAIRKLTYAPEKSGPQPSAEVTREFMMSSGTLRLEATLDKEKYYHGESISVNVLVDNNTNKTVKKIKISVRQLADINLFSINHYKCVVGDCESEEGFPIYPSQTGWCKVYRVCPLLSNNREKRGLALDGKIKHEDTNLASSTIIVDPQKKETMGIIVQYKVRIRLVLGFGTSDLNVELPVMLTHPKPPEDPLSLPSLHSCSSGPPSVIGVPSRHQGPSKPSSGGNGFHRPPKLAQLSRGGSTEDPIQHQKQPPVEHQQILDMSLRTLEKNIPQIGTPKHETNILDLSTTLEPSTITDDLIFESFARLRLKGEDTSVSHSLEC